MIKYIILLLFLFLELALAHHPKKLEKVSLQLHWHYQFEFAGFIAAKEKGFYKEVGLDVMLKEYEQGIDINSDVLSGKSNFGIYNSLSLLEYLQGDPLVLVSSYFKRAALVLVTSPDIKTPRDLVGKRVMASTKEDFILNFQPYLNGYGVDVDSLELVPHTYNVDAFVEGNVSAMTAFVSNELEILNEKGIKYNVLDPSDDNIFVMQLELITSLKEAKEHPYRVEAFRKASLKGWNYALKHKKEIIDIIYEKYTHDRSKESMLQQARMVEKLILPYTYSIGSIDKNFLTKQMRLFQEYYNIGRDKKLNNYIFEDIYSLNKPDFTVEELAYIKKSPSVSVCLHYNQFPIDGYKDGKFVGIMSNVYKKISESTSLKFKPIASTSREEFKRKIKSGVCDLISIYATKTKEYTNFKPTSSFYKTHFTLVSKLDKSFVISPLELKGKILLAQIQEYKKYLKNLYPFLTIEVVQDSDEMMKKLLNDEAYAVIALDEQADYIIDKYGYGKLKINGFLSKEKPIEGSIGVQKENEILYLIIEKALEKISPEEIQNIINSWRITRYQSVVDYTLVIGVVVFMSIILLIMIYYQRKLKNFNKELEISVDKKTKELREINETLEGKIAEKVLELIQKDEILTVQSKQAIMGEMISMIAHQWRQPLNTITLSISSIQIKHLMGEDMESEELQKRLDDINETITYLSETVDDFKTYFHPDKKREHLDVDRLLHKAINFISARLKSNRVEIKILEESNIHFDGYQNELVQVLLNILNNAIDAYGSHPNIQERVIELYAKLEGQNIVIYVKDSAGGIESSHIKQLFEPYFSTKGKNGTGLGLYMSQMIIQKQFKGEIKVKSQGGTTTFMISIPKEGNV